MLFHVLLFLILGSASALTPTQTISRSFSPAQGLINAILFPYFERSDREAGRLKDYIRDQVDKGSMTIACSFDVRSPPELTEQAFERKCHAKDVNCCLIKALSHPKDVSIGAVTLLKDECFEKKNTTACFALIGTSKTTTEVGLAAGKGCDQDSHTMCLVQASILYGLHKDKKKALSIFEGLCRSKKHALACYMASIHQEKVEKNAGAAEGLMKEACALGFRYRCEN